MINPVRPIRSDVFTPSHLSGITEPDDAYDIVGIIFVAKANTSNRGGRYREKRCRWSCKFFFFPPLLPP